jgi:hypothetical protein
MSRDGPLLLALDALSASPNVSCQSPSFLSYTPRRTSSVATLVSRLAGAERRLPARRGQRSEQGKMAARQGSASQASEERDPVRVDARPAVSGARPRPALVALIIHPVAPPFNAQILRKDSLAMADHVKPLPHAETSVCEPRHPLMNHTTPTHAFPCSFFTSSTRTVPNGFASLPRPVNAACTGTDRASMGC